MGIPMILFPIIVWLTPNSEKPQLNRENWFNGVNRI